MGWPEPRVERTGAVVRIEFNGGSRHAPDDTLLFGPRQSRRRLPSILRTNDGKHGCSRAVLIDFTTLHVAYDPALSNRYGFERDRCNRPIWLNYSQSGARSRFSTVGSPGARTHSLLLRRFVPSLIRPSGASCSRTLLSSPLGGFLRSIFEWMIYRINSRLVGIRAPSDSRTGREGPIRHPSPRRDPNDGIVGSLGACLKALHAS